MHIADAVAACNCSGMESNYASLTKAATSSRCNIQRVHNNIAFCFVE